MACCTSSSSIGLFSVSSSLRDSYRKIVCLYNWDLYCWVSGGYQNDFSRSYCFLIASSHGATFVLNRGR